MPRPKSDDPKEALTIRLRRSTRNKMFADASNVGMTPRELAESVLEDRFGDQTAPQGPVPSRVAEARRPRDAIEAALDAAIHDGGPFDTTDGQARIAIEALYAAGFRVVHPERTKEDCMDPWVCCIHERPKEGK